MTSASKPKPPSTKPSPTSDGSSDWNVKSSTPTLAVYRHREWMKAQPWSGRPVQPREKVVANHHLTSLEWQLEDAIEALAEERSRE